MNNTYFLDVTNNINVVLIITIILIALILIILVIKNKSQKNIEILDEQTTDTEKDNNKHNIKEIPIKKTSIIEDPATVRMSIEEAKADLSKFNVENNNENDENKDDEII